MKKRYIGLFGFLAFMLLVSLVLKPVPILPEEELAVTRGTVDRIFEGGEFDIVFKLRETEKYYYINRGLEQGLNLDNLRNKLLGRRVTIKYPEYWSILGDGSTHHLSKLEHNGQTIFSEVPQ